MVIETLVAESIWAAAHAIPEGEGIAGQHGRQGYMLFMGVLFRPSLMIVGFFMSTMILTAVGSLIGTGFQVFSSGMRSGTFGFGGFITLLSFLFLVGGIIITASHRLFGLITWIPDNVLKWIGHNPHGLGEQEAEGKIRAAFGGFVTGLQSAARPHRGGGKPPKTDPDKDPDAKGNTEKKAKVTADMSQDGAAPAAERTTL